MEEYQEPGERPGPSDVRGFRAWVARCVSSSCPVLRRRQGSVALFYRDLAWFRHFPPSGTDFLYSPGRFGFSPGFCVAIVRLSLFGSATSLAASGLPGLGPSSAAAVLRRDGQPHRLVPIPRALSQLLGTFQFTTAHGTRPRRTKITAM